MVNLLMKQQGVPESGRRKRQLEKIRPQGHKGRREYALYALGLNCPILFHPDCNRRLWPFTRSADPLLKKRSARGLSVKKRNTAGGEFHPALRISLHKLNHKKVALSNKRIMSILMLFSCWF
ncbi:hypothetical protein X474_14470 [Dethiosulfatarculus sandiegensis]|uniref:Uncharacterized protein n=1 Tax=Dethiosulfatarculus sandiegensis TaxID=1429043 RepID=A0A0D2HSD4_9BACT|nr:hypothetical protein X474_14470 [Dethiosulfatarculus sandiegensis]